MESLVLAITYLHNIMLSEAVPLVGSSHCFTQRAPSPSRIRQVESRNLQCCAKVYYGHESCRKHAFVRPKTGLHNDTHRFGRVARDITQGSGAAHTYGRSTERR
ncbi:hypothetical protein C8Q74DRAFT_354218 [Fomes fomentarius]|nr:hypothetical protein C8Q74DRAFT_354218 [Fomes fomentarius]